MIACGVRFLSTDFPSIPKWLVITQIKSTRFEYKPISTRITISISEHLQFATNSLGDITNKIRNPSNVKRTECYYIREWWNLSFIFTTSSEASHLSSTSYDQWKQNTWKHDYRVWMSISPYKEKIFFEDVRKCYSESSRQVYTNRWSC